MSGTHRLSRQVWGSVSAIVLALAMGWACGHSPTEADQVGRQTKRTTSTPSPSLTPLPTVSPSPPPRFPFSRYTISGTLLNEDGTPASGGYVEVDYFRGDGTFSDPPSHCPDFPQWCWLLTHVNGAGQYSVQLDAAPHSNYLGGIGLIYSGDATQLVPSGNSNVVLNLRSRRLNQIATGESSSVSIEPDSAICTDLEGFWAFDHRCEIVRVVVSQAGTLQVDAQPTDPGRSRPAMFLATTGNYGGSVRTGPGFVSVAVNPGTFSIYIGSPASDITGPTSYSVTTALQR